MRIVCTAIWIPAVTCLSGCLEPEANTVSFQRQRLADVSYQVAFDAAAQALGERFHVSHRDAATGVIRGESRRTADDRDPEPADVRPLSAPLGVPRRFRRVAELRVRRDGDGIEFSCRIRVQENRADTVRMLRREHGVYDQPYDTPIDRDAGTTEAQNTVWRNRRRDREMERSVLSAVREIIGDVER